MKKLLTKLNIIGQNVTIGAIFGWFAFAISFDIMAIILYAFFPETWSEVAYHMHQFLGIH
jgi:hypothetical protein